MCEPTTLFAVSLAIAAASTAASFKAQDDAANSQVKYQEAQAEAQNRANLQNAQNAIKEQTEATTAERMQQMQNNEAASRELQQNQSDYLQKRGQAIASSPWGGGASFDALLADYGRVYAQNNDVAKEQLRMQGVMADTNIRGYRDTAQSRINTAQGYIPAPVNGPSALAAGLGFASSALGSYNSATNYGRTELTAKSG